MKAVQRHLDGFPTPYPVVPGGGRCSRIAARLFGRAGEATLDWELRSLFAATVKRDHPKRGLDLSTTAAALQPNTIVTGPMLPELVQVIVTVPLGASIKLIAKGLRTGQVHEPILSPEQIATLRVSHPAGREPFDGDATRFRLGSEVMRLGLAYKYDPSPSPTRRR